MSRGICKSCALDPSRDDLLGRRLPRQTCGWMIGEGVKLLLGLSQDVAGMSFDSSESAFDLSYTVTDDTEISLF